MFINNGVNFRSQSIVNSAIGNGNIVIVRNGNFVATDGDTSIEHVHTFKITALDKNGKEMKSYQIPSGTSIDIRIEPSEGAECKIDRIDSSVANIHAKQCQVRDIKTASGDVHFKGTANSIHTASGDVEIEKCGNIDSITTMSGDVDIKDCGNVGNIETMSGNIRTNKRKLGDNDGSTFKRKKK